ncbi:MAG: hypothetical protein MRY57_00675, partial [Candidatus Pacebacteria bacterium]|nr:hypothetical protein [Candidatus Paceibacterota bacterium]
LVDLFNFANLLNDNGGVVATKPFLNLNIFKTKEIENEEKMCNDINSHLSKLNRDPYSMNRAKEKLPSTVNNVYVGGVHGFFTHPVSFWLNKKPEPVLEKWVKNFVSSHTNGIMKALS